MPIEVLLRKSVETLGKVGEVVRVRPGYARNYLLPWGIAVMPSAENLRLVEKDKAAEAVLEAERAKQRAELAERLSSTQVVIEAKANPEGHLFGSVGTRQLIEALKAKGFELEERYVSFEPVKTVGKHEAKIRLGGDTEVALEFHVVEEGGSVAPPTAAPAAQAASPEKGPKAKPAKPAEPAAESPKKSKK